MSEPEISSMLNVNSVIWKAQNGVVSYAVVAMRIVSAVADTAVV
jgi:hypothetical protein